MKNQRSTGTVILGMMTVWMMTACKEQPRAAQPVSLSVADVGFLGPESALYDAAADVYLVSNINGGAFDEDDNGFISRVSPDGKVLALKWVDGADPAITLNGPKGLALHGDTLFAADVGGVRMFDRNSGASLGSRPVPGASLLNDVAAGPDGQIYFTDSGVKPGFEPSGTDAVLRFGPGGAVETVRKGADLGQPNGVFVDSTGVVVVSMGSGEVYQLIGNDRHPLPKLPGGVLDGVERLSDGSLLISSWEGKAVYRLSKDGNVTVAADSVEGPADIGYDAKRHRVLIPLLNANRLEIRSVAGGG